jgi:hypothetical protein
MNFFLGCLTCGKTGDFDFQGGTDCVEMLPRFAL